MEDFCDAEDEARRSDATINKTVARVEGLVRSRRESRLRRLMTRMERAELCQGAATQLISGIEGVTDPRGKLRKVVIDPVLQRMRHQWGIERQEECPCQEDLANGNDDAVFGDAGATYPSTEEGERIWGEITAPPSQSNSGRHRVPSPLRTRMSQLFSGLSPETLRSNRRA